MKNYSQIYGTSDRKYITELNKYIVDLQEKGAYPQKFEMPITVQYELTAKCNLKCLHCYNRSGDGDKESVMTTKQWIDLSKQLVEWGGIFQCILSGGEPLLLGNDLLSIMDVLHDDGTSFVLITNGYLLNQNWIEKLSKYRFFWLQVSIDGAKEEYHDKFRGVNESWRRAVNGAFQISRYGLPLVIAHTVTPENLKTLDQMVDLAYQLGASSIILGEVLPSGRAISNAKIMLTANERNYMYEQIEILQSRYKSKIEIQRSSSVKYQLSRYQIMPNSGIIVRPNGDLRIDCMAPFILGNILETDFSTIWKEKGAECWQQHLVKDFINSIDEFTNENSVARNHVDGDILL